MKWQEFVAIKHLLNLCISAICKFCQYVVYIHYLCHFIGTGMEKKIAKKAGPGVQASPRRGDPITL